MKLKKWVENLLIMIIFIAILVIASDCKSTLIFVLSKLVALVVIVTNAMLLEKYGR